MKSPSVLIHFAKSVDVKNHLNDLGLEYKESKDELDVIVDDVPYEIVNGIYQDPDEQLCEFYNINYDYVNMMELN